MPKPVAPYVPSGDEQIALNAVSIVGHAFRGLHKKLGTIFTAEVRDQIRSIKDNVFQIVAGSKGRSVNISINGGIVLPMRWEEYVRDQFDCTSGWLGGFLRTNAEILAREARQAEREAKEKAERDEADRQLEARRVENERIIKEHSDAAKREAAATVPLLKPVDAPDDLMPAPMKPTSKPVSKPVDSTNPEMLVPFLNLNAQAVMDDMRDTTYDFFGQFGDELQTMAGEIVSMLREFHLDLSSIELVSRYMVTAAKKDFKDAAAAKAA
jgi:hypothetical protein